MALALDQRCILDMPPSDLLLAMRYQIQAPDSAGRGSPPLDCMAMQRGTPGIAAHRMAVCRSVYGLSACGRKSELRHAPWLIILHILVSTVRVQPLNGTNHVHFYAVVLMYMASYDWIADLAMLAQEVPTKSRSTCVVWCALQHRCYRHFSIVMHSH